MTKTRRKNRVAVVVALLLCLQNVGDFGKVYANDIAEHEEAVSSPEIRRVNLNINGTIAGINDPSAPTDSEASWSNGTGTKIWFGGNNASHLFNVLDSDADDFTQDGRKTLFVESNSRANVNNIIFDKEIDNGQSAISDWKNSDVYQYLNSVTGYGYLTSNFNSVERSVITDSYNESHSEWTYGDDYFIYAPLTGEKIFLLDAREARSEKYGFYSNRDKSRSRSRSNRAWWIRSGEISNRRLAGQVSAEGLITSYNASISKADCYPAMNINLDSVFFSISYSAGRPGQITAMDKKDEEKTWYLTIFDGNKDFDAELDCDSSIYEQDPVKLKINDLGTAPSGVYYDQISAMLVKNDGTVAAYGMIAESSDDEIEFSVPDGVEPGEYTLKVFAEHTQHSRTTNYSSNACDLQIVLFDKKNAPANAPDAVMEVDNTVKKLSDMPALPSGWEWDQEMADTSLIQNGSVNVNAYYTGEDKDDYENTTVSVEIKRQACVEGEILFTGADDILPNCIESGYGHTECTLCGDVIRSAVEVAPAGHDWEDDYQIDKSASCSEEGIKSIHCKNCDAKKETVGIEKSEHTPDSAVRENEVGSSCGKAGSYEEVVYCSECGIELSREEKEIEKTDHIPAEKVIENSVDSDCQNKGTYDEVVYCSVCNEELERVHKQSDMKDHIEGEAVRENEIQSTCSSEGSYDLVVYCKDCHEELSRESIVVEKKAHTPSEDIHENENAATCSSEGSYDEVVYCRDCGAEISRIHSIIDKLQHTPGNKVIENRVEATSEADGSYDEVIYCTDCHAEMSRSSVPIPKITSDLGGDKQGTESSQTNDSEKEKKDNGDKKDSVSNGDTKSSEKNEDTQTPASSDSDNTIQKPAENQEDKQDSSVSDNRVESTPSTDSGTSNNISEPSASDNTKSDNSATGNSSQSVSDNSRDQSSSQSASGGSSSSGGTQDQIFTPATDSSSGSSSSGGGYVSDSSSTSEQKTDESSKDDTSSTNVNQDSFSGTDQNQTNDGHDNSSQDKNNGEESVKAPSQAEPNTSEKKTIPEKGSVITDEKSSYQYKVVSAGSSKRAVQLRSIPSNERVVTIPSKVTIDDISYKVTGIADGAFKNRKKLKKVVIGKNITMIGKSAFKGCSKLNTITIKSKSIKKIGAGAFVGINKKAVVKVPKKMLAKYKKLLKKAKTSKKVKLKTY